MLEDVLGVCQSNPLLWVFIQTLENQVLELGGNIDLFGEGGLDLDYPIQHGVVIFIVKRRKSEGHLIEEDSKAPNVHLFVMSLFQDDFGGDVFGSADIRVRLLALLKDFGNSKIRQTSVSVFIQQNVLGLQISVYYVKGVEIGETRQNLGPVEFGHFFSESLLGPKVGVELSTLLEFHGEEDEAGIGEAVL